MYNLTRYKVGDRVIVGKDYNGYPHEEVIIIEKAPKMVKVITSIGSYWANKRQKKWLSADIWYVITKIPLQ